MSTRATGGYLIAGREDAVTSWPPTPATASSAGTAMRLGPSRCRSSWRRMPAGTGGRGSYGHRHPGQEEVYFVIAGTVTFKVGADVFEAGPADRGADDRRGGLLAPQRHRRRG